MLGFSVFPAREKLAFRRCKARRADPYSPFFKRTLAKPCEEDEQFEAVKHGDIAECANQTQEICAQLGVT